MVTSQDQFEEIQSQDIDRAQFIAELIEKFNSGEATLSYSAISKFKRSPKAFIDYKMEAKQQTDAMKLGSIVHCLVLEPEKFDGKYISDKEICETIGGAKPRATTKYKEWRDSQGAEVVSESVLQESKKMAGAVLNNFAAVMALNQCDKRESKMVFEFNGLNFISFLDADGNITCDLKICADAEPKKFQRDIFNMSYHLQAAIYSVASGELKPYYIIAVDRNAEVSVHRLEEDLIEYGIREFEKLTNEFKSCISNNDFDKSFEYRATGLNQTHTVSKPAWL